MATKILWVIASGIVEKNWGDDKRLKPEGIATKQGVATGRARQNPTSFLLLLLLRTRTRLRSRLRSRFFSWAFEKCLRNWFGLVAVAVV